MKRWVYVKWVRMTTVKNSLFILSRFPFIRYDIQLHIIHMVKFIPWTSVMELCNRNTRCREYPIINRGSPNGFSNHDIPTQIFAQSRNPNGYFRHLAFHAYAQPVACLHFALKSRIPPFKYNKANLPFCRKATSSPGRFSLAREKRPGNEVGRKTKWKLSW